MNSIRPLEQHSHPDEVNYNLRSISNLVENRHRSRLDNVVYFLVGVAAAALIGFVASNGLREMRKSYISPETPQEMRERYERDIRDNEMPPIYRPSKQYKGKIKVA